uniref:Uncharacterized protein LOC102806286 n=1 Tax=Saccoglossus kowalevskii TaxID=10224 RepID=A0ABM0M9B2_SACKO|nr:PREDICTED: uncharacterized protein LOC102806286 [Saccoglossus kowalevskii]
MVDAFKLIPIHPSLWNLYGIQWDSQFYTVFHLLDDFLTVDPPSCDVDRTMVLLTLLTVVSLLKYPYLTTKTVGPTKCLEYLGIELDTIAMETPLPEDKLNRMLNLVVSFLARKSCTKRELPSPLGHLNFTCKLVIPGLTFISCLLEISKGVKSSNYHVTLSPESKQDLLMWHQILSNWNGVSMFLEAKTTLASDMQPFTDASSIRHGGISAVIGLMNAGSTDLSLTLMQHCSSHLKNCTQS